MRTKATRSYEWNALCDICKFKFKASKLRRRWDGFMVCKDDWETRHPLDFYTVRNDTHLLPFTRTDTENEVSYTPTVAVTTAGTITKTGKYYRDLANTRIQFQVQIVPADPRGSSDTSAASSTTCSTPTTTVGTGTFTVFGSSRGLIGTGSISAGATNFTLPNWDATSEVITITGRYGS